MKATHFAIPSRATWLPYLGLPLLVALLLPPVRHAAESSMTAHMLVQYAGLLLAGGLLASLLPVRWQQGLQRWNELGIAGLVGSALTLAVSMVPRVLDLALLDWRVESLKLLALVLSGAALRLSWRPAGIVVQAFFLGNVLPMMGVVGTLYQDWDTRVCNAYRLDDQHDLGLALVWITLSVAIAWLLQLGLQRREPAPILPTGAPDAPAGTTETLRSTTPSAGKA